MEIRWDAGESALVAKLPEKLNSMNSEEIFRELEDAWKSEGEKDRNLWLDAAQTKEITSAGIRILLKLYKRVPHMVVLNAQPYVVEIASLSGINQLIDFFPPFRELSVENCRLIGQGKNGRVYRISEEELCKVFRPRCTLGDVILEKQMSRRVSALSLPAVLSFQIVRVGECFGIVYEMLNARCFNEVLRDHPEQMDELLKRFVCFMNEIHQTPAPNLTDLKKVFRKRNIEPAREMLDEEAGERLVQVFERIPDSKGFIHGDFHFGNLFIEDDELMMIDLESAGFGDSIWELIGLYSTFVVFQMINPEDVVHLGGTDQYAFIWERIMDYWCELTGANREETQRVITILARARVLSFSRRRGYSPEVIRMMQRSLCEALECMT